jgi:hypothetical protein
MNKKPYEAPTVKKVRLEVKNAVLGICNTSSAPDAITPPGCKITIACPIP